MQGPHDKIIAAAAKVALGSVGFRRKGQSRLWLADQSWWLVVVEFQPSSWSKGSYLNVAAHWLWSDMGHISFDYGGRVSEFEPYQSDEQFDLAASRLANCAAEKARETLSTFPSTEVAADFLNRHERNRPARERGHWSAYHAAVAAGLVGRVDDAREMFGAILGGDAPEGSVLKSSALRMSQIVADHAVFRRTVSSLVTNQRQTLKLPVLQTSPF